jgi:hypothetical protein
MNYDKKYLKYKNKYLNLKYYNLKGGTIFSFVSGITNEHIHDIDIDINTIILEEFITQINNFTGFTIYDYTLIINSNKPINYITYNMYRLKTLSEIFRILNIVTLEPNFKIQIIKNDKTLSLLRQVFYQDLPDNSFYFLNNNELALNYNFDRELHPEVLPDSLIHLNFGKKFNQPLVKDLLPNSLTTLTLGYYFDKPLVKDVFPNSLTNLTINTNKINLLDPYILPNSLTHLNLGEYFNQEINNKLPLTITHLTFGRYFHNKGRLLLRRELPSNLISLNRIDHFIPDPTKSTLISVDKDYSQHKLVKIDNFEIDVNLSGESIIVIENEFNEMDYH